MINIDNKEKQELLGNLYLEEKKVSMKLRELENAINKVREDYSRKKPLLHLRVIQDLEFNKMFKKTAMMTKELWPYICLQTRLQALINWLEKGKLYHAYSPEWSGSMFDPPQDDPLYLEVVDKSIEITDVSILELEKQMMLEMADKGILDTRIVENPIYEKNPKGKK